MNLISVINTCVYIKISRWFIFLIDKIIFLSRIHMRSFCFSMVFLNLQIFPHKAKVQNKVKSNLTKPWLNIIDTNLGVVYSEESSGALAVEILGL